MESRDPRQALDALAGEHALPILRFLRDREWTLASQVAEGLGIHTTTAGKYLAAFHAAGFVERRSHRSRRATHAYRLRNPVIRIELDLAEPREGEDVSALAEGFVDALLQAAGRVGGTRLQGELVRGALGGEDWRQTLRGDLRSSDATAQFHRLIAKARRTCEEFVGPAATARLLHLAAKAATEGRADVARALGLEVGP